MDDVEFRRFLRIDVTELNFWIEEGWLVPDAAEERLQFRDSDVARAQLILDLTRKMGLNEAGVDVVMDLVDQLHGLRGTMRRLLAAISQQEQEVQQRLLSALADLERYRD
ncbi:chaperone modulator CbpM [Rhizobium mongolense]|uniref:Transcriptional regulator protein n=1 Tax=Rhizobium gallicum TaxID=56730 RepID=A0A1L5NVW3_9HYPH|nr:chaperone modulator CbpM [Rhizobium gallicum]APO72032.1 transcriptional regulator protein [Rhizobium gallicum]